MPFELGYNTNGFAHHRLTDALRLLADIGYQSVAITLDHHALNPSCDHSGGTRWGLPLMRAGFESAIESRPPRDLTRSGQGVDLGMGATEPLVPAFTEEVQVLIDNHRADGGIGLDQAESPTRELEGVPHHGL